jgi:hypothetical protein
MTIQAQLTIVAVTWLISMVISAAALFLAIMDPLRRFGLLLILASAAMCVGYLGFGRWTPFLFFPQIGYTWSSGDFQISLSSQWFFLMPLVLGTTALFIGVGKRRRLSRVWHETHDLSSYARSVAGARRPLR